MFPDELVAGPLLNAELATGAGLARRLFFLRYDWMLTPWIDVELVHALPEAARRPQGRCAEYRARDGGHGSGSTRRWSTHPGDACGGLALR